MTSKKEVMKWVVLALQCFVGFWQILKLTPLGAVLQSVMAAWLLRYLRLSQTYSRLKELDGCVFKTVKWHVFTELPSTPRVKTRDRHEIILPYLRKDFRLKRNRNILSLEGEMAYYITEEIWQELLLVEAVCLDSNCAVFLKGHKPIWEQVATGRVMSFPEILDSVIIERQFVRTIQDSTCQLLPVDLTVSQERLLKFINLVSVFMERYEEYWVIAAVLSCTSAVLEFSSQLRTFLYRNIINRVFCFIMHKIFDRLPRSMRRHVYSLGMWVENLKPCNDIQLKVVRGNIHVTIAGGAKAENDGATLLQLFPLAEGERKRTFHCDSMDIGMECIFEANGRCVIRATTFPDRVCEDVGWDIFKKIVTLVDSIARNKCGTLKSYENNKVRVRGLSESIDDYSKNNFPDIYELKLNENDVIM